ncbi:sensor domain-containing diguanylate cyclase [Paenibacillus sp. YN15]|uniref:sensor domain-containing diguanylate cyclase n=1 Tax=Paenibacillus sp. YN15 TaxID=1742774 RepID=UPI000DCB7520|nr:diguanylate cyclase [Paenibacillus sp. YN15]RAV04543.1 GGDEF domain-containing protein [Paenibacillus sp. YN15]
MESQSIGREPASEERLREEDGAAAAPCRLQLNPEYCEASAASFGNDIQWIALAKAAFDDWAKQAEPVLSAEAKGWFIRDASGNWLEFREAAPLSCPGAELREGLLRHGIDPNGECSGVFRVSGEQIAQMALHDSRGNPALALGLVMREGYPASADSITKLGLGFPGWLYVHIEKTAGRSLRNERIAEERETRKKDILFQMALDLYSKIDTDEVLGGMIRRINELYPDAGIDLLMTQEQPRSGLPVKVLNFAGMDEHVCTRAFMEGKIVIDECRRPGEFQMAVPISGKQGIYGVMHLHSHKGNFGPADIRIMQVLSSAAGSAFENAKLYEQSNLLVNELRLINELTKQLNQSLKMKDIFNFASAELMQTFKADYCCILQLNQGTGKFVVHAANVPAILQETFDENSGFAGAVCKSKEPVIVSDYWAQPNAPTSRLMQLTGARSLIVAPLLVHDEAKGAILVAHQQPGFFSYDNYKLLQVLAGHIGLALTNASLHAEVRRMVITDNLTGLYARSFLDEQVGNHQKKDVCGSLIVVDIDYFKQVNDTYGHQVGDEILIQVSKIIRSCIRDTDIAARWGGEELAIYLPQVMAEQALRIAERIRFRVEKDTRPSVTVSCGVSEWHWKDDKISVESLFYRSDMALYKAKHVGRNRIMNG